MAWLWVKQTTDPMKIRTRRLMAAPSHLTYFKTEYKTAWAPASIITARRSNQNNCVLFASSPVEFTVQRPPIVQETCIIFPEHIYSDSLSQQLQTRPTIRSHNFLIILNHLTRLLQRTPVEQVLLNKWHSSSLESFLYGCSPHFKNKLTVLYFKHGA